MRDLLAALNTGHEGGCGTIHANSPGDVPARFEALGALADMSPEAVRTQFASAIDVVLHVRRQGGDRVLDEIGLVHREAGGVRVVPALERRSGQLRPAAAYPQFMRRLEASGPRADGPKGPRELDGPVNRAVRALRPVRAVNAIRTGFAVIAVVLATAAGLLWFGANRVAAPTRSRSTGPDPRAVLVDLVDGLVAALGAGAAPAGAVEVTCRLAAGRLSQERTSRCLSRNAAEAAAGADLVEVWERAAADLRGVLPDRSSPRLPADGRCRRGSAARSPRAWL